MTGFRSPDVTSRYLKCTKEEFFTFFFLGSFGNFGAKNDFNSKSKESQGQSRCLTAVNRLVLILALGVVVGPRL